MTRLPRALLRGASLLALGGSLTVAMIDATHPMFNDCLSQFFELTHHDSFIRLLLHRTRS